MLCCNMMPLIHCRKWKRTNFLAKSMDLEANYHKIFNQIAFSLEINISLQLNFQIGKMKFSNIFILSIEIVIKYV